MKLQEIDDYADDVLPDSVVEALFYIVCIGVFLLLLGIGTLLWYLYLY